MGSLHSNVIMLHVQARNRCAAPFVKGVFVITPHRAQTPCNRRRDNVSVSDCRIIDSYYICSCVFSRSFVPSQTIQPTSVLDLSRQLSTVVRAHRQLLSKLAHCSTSCSLHYVRQQETCRLAVLAQLHCNSRASLSGIRHVHRCLGCHENQPNADALSYCRLSTSPRVAARPAIVTVTIASTVFASICTRNGLHYAANDTVMRLWIAASLVNEVILIWASDH
ncbi:hypothetical protein BDV95DRAFT_65434 [Massariosphaeria phaeospora]|uniref:Uncharacterized protein n=1 Tax=Massariosphaeria phaeospora TaxID=100035 RepID=A0A7C8I4H4_9PLEO|nr:hypothetical protein BDV95DRAFT_65434 [Massariosphaeria phaeospora]